MGRVGKGGTTSEVGRGVGGMGVAIWNGFFNNGLDALMQLPNGTERLELEKIAHSVVKRNE